VKINKAVFLKINAFQADSKLVFEHSFKSWLCFLTKKWYNYYYFK